MNIFQYSITKTVKFVWLSFLVLCVLIIAGGIMLGGGWGGIVILFYGFPFPLLALCFYYIYMFIKALTKGQMLQTEENIVATWISSIVTLAASLFGIYVSCALLINW